jgi:hypothetical protein
VCRQGFGCGELVDNRQFSVLCRTIANQDVVSMLSGCCWQLGLSRASLTCGSLLPPPHNKCCGCPGAPWYHNKPPSPASAISSSSSSPSVVPSSTASPRFLHALLGSSLGTKTMATAPQRQHQVLLERSARAGTRYLAGQRRRFRVRTTSSRRGRLSWGSMERCPGATVCARWCVRQFTRPESFFVSACRLRPPLPPPPPPPLLRATTPARIGSLSPHPTPPRVPSSAPAARRPTRPRPDTIRAAAAAAHDDGPEAHLSGAPR